MREDGLEVPCEVFERISPYTTEHINRLGEYRLDLSRVVPILDFKFKVFQ
jgi:hypothetical protein